MIEEKQITELGYELRMYRIRCNMTQQKLAQHLGVSTNTIHLWETRACKPSMGSLLEISDLLGEPLLVVLQKSKNYYT